MRTVVAYDVTDNNARARLAAALGSIGERLQKSVFLCDVDDKDLAAVLHRAAKLINHETDSVHVFPQCAECHADVHTLGQAHVPQAVEYWIIQ
jgi:CRISPR-associated protein Cas2